MDQGEEGGGLGARCPSDGEKGTQVNSHPKRQPLRVRGGVGRGI